MVHLLENCGFSHSCIIQEEEKLAVVDIGSVGTARDIEEFITGKLGLALENVRHVLVTHFHFDHIAGIGFFLKQCPAATKVLFHPLVREYLAGEREIPRMKNWLECLWPAAIFSAGYLRRAGHLHFETLAGTPLPLLRRIRFLPYGADRIGFFDFNSQAYALPEFPDWVVVETPGHTADSCCFQNTKTGELICGDLFVNFRWTQPRLNPFGQDRQAIRETFRRLKAEISPRTIYPAHGMVIHDDSNALDKIRGL